MCSSNSDSSEERIQNIEKDLAAVQQTLKNIINSGGKNDQTASINDLFIKMMKLENEFDQANKKGTIYLISKHLTFISNLAYFNI